MSTDFGEDDGEELEDCFYDLKLLILMSVVAFGAAFCGSALLTVVSNDFMKPLLFFILIGLAVYTFKKKNFGQQQEKSHSVQSQMLYAVIISLLVGFYDGFIGPGTGSFLVLGFVYIS